MTSRKYDIIYKSVIADGAFSLTRDKQVTYIKVDARLGKSAIEIQKALKEVGSEFVLPYSSITRWVRQFNNGRNTVSYKHLCGRPLSAKTGENVENVAKLLNEDRIYSCDEIAHELDKSHRSVNRIITERLHLCGRPLSATTGENVENVAKLLNEDKIYSCDEIAHELDKSHRSVHRIITERLQMRKIAARWVPHMLSESEKTNV